MCTTDLDEDHEFFRYQDMVNKSVRNVPSHVVIHAHQSEHGEDYRYEEEENPCGELRDRKKDNTDLGRK